MGLLTKEVEILLSSRIIKYYEDLGYYIPREGFVNGKPTVKRGTKIKVRVDDLLENSNVFVDVECDVCKKILPMKYQTYNMCRHNDKYYCNHCKICGR